MMFVERGGSTVLPLLEMQAPEMPYAGSVIRCSAHRLDDFGQTRTQDDVAPYECADCVNERNDHVVSSLSFFDGLDDDRRTRKQNVRDEYDRVWGRKLTRREDRIR
jgi:hypothetical protein